MSHSHSHGHSHGHSGGNGDFDWEAMADALELDAAITLPIVHDIVRTCTPHVDWATVGHVLDTGCGPGAVAVALCRHAPAARVTALDTSAPLLGRVRHRAAELGLDDRIWTIAADLDSPLPALPDADVVWASMVMHHVTDPVTTLEQLRARLAAGGTLVVVEFGNAPTVLPATDPLRESGTWSRFQEATTSSLNERLGVDPVAIDWPALLDRAHFVDIIDTALAAHHPSPLDEIGRAWLTAHVRRGVEMAGDRLDVHDVAALSSLVEQIPTRTDLFVHAERRVIVARRPPPTRRVTS